MRRSRADVERAALALALAGEPEGTVIVQKRNSEARVQFSVVVRPPPGSPSWMLRPIAAFCTSDGIRKDTGIMTWIRWPDCVVVEGAVVATTSVVLEKGSDPRWAVMTSRINNGFIIEREDGGITSLHDLLGTNVDGQLLMEKVLESLSWMYYGFSRGMHSHILKRLRSMLDTIGRRVVLVRDGMPIIGTVRDIDGKGRLVVIPDMGRRLLRVEFGESFRELSDG